MRPDRAVWAYPRHSTGRVRTCIDTPPFARGQAFSDESAEAARERRSVHPLGPNPIATASFRRSRSGLPARTSAAA